MTEAYEATGLVASKGGSDNHASLAVQQANAVTVANAITMHCGFIQR